MNWISVEDELPADNQYVLVHLTLDNWRDRDDPDGNRYCKVAKFVRGLSIKERQLLPDSDQRKKTYRAGDEEGNNKFPYYWDTFGTSRYFGQDVDFWCELLLPIPA
jgi:hypothetical protein